MSDFSSLRYTVKCPNTECDYRHYELAIIPDKVAEETPMDEKLMPWNTCPKCQANIEPFI